MIQNFAWRSGGHTSCSAIAALALLRTIALFKLCALRLLRSRLELRLETEGHSSLKREKAIAGDIQRLRLSKTTIRLLVPLVIFICLDL